VYFLIELRDLERISNSAKKDILKKVSQGN